jgi:arylsulfatase A-like enzyme
VVPFGVALGTWGVGTAAILRHVLGEDDFVTAEIRRHGLLPELLETLAAFALPYLALALYAAIVARGIARLSRARNSLAARFEGWIATAIVLFGLCGAAVYTTVERPAIMAGFLWQRGGTARAIQGGLASFATPSGIAALFLGALGTISAAACWGYVKHGGPRFRRVAVVVLSIGLMAVTALWLLPGTRRSRGTVAASAPPNVVLIIVDSLRPDRAADPSVAPNLAALAARSVRFNDARSPCALTYPAIATLLTSRHPVRHRVRHLYPERAVRWLGPGTLPRRLSGAGYATAAVGGYCATALRELDAGFDRQRTPRSEVDLVVTAVALRGHPWLPAILRWPWTRSLLPQLRTAVEGGHPADQAAEVVAAWREMREPFFVAAFFDNTHLPYVPVWPDSDRAPDYDGPNRYTVLSGDLVEQVREGESGFQARASAAERANALSLYDGAVRSVDRGIGRVLAALERDGLRERTIVVLVADHGENLLDGNGPLAHGDAMERDRSTSIPWWISWPGRLEPREVRSPVSLADVGPTLLALLELPPTPDVDGVARDAELLGRPGPEERPLLLETGMWFVAQEAVASLDDSGRGLTYPSFDEGLLDVESGEPPHIVVREEQRDDVVRAKHRRLEWGDWALTYRPRTTGASFRLYRRDTDPTFTLDLSKDEPGITCTMVAAFYAEALRLGEDQLVPPEDPALDPAGTLCERLAAPPASGGG